MLVQTKLFLPRRRPRQLERRTLVERLGQHPEGTVTVLSAPAGFGKSSLVASWAHAVEAPVAWLSLEPADSDPARFWSYFFAAIQRVAPDLTDPICAQIETGSPPPARVMVGELINAAAGSETPLWIALDDLHCVERPEIHDELVFFIEHLPANLGLVVTTRVDPPWPIPRLRASGFLTELRAHDLRLDGSEVRQFFVEVTGLDLSQEQIGAMASRTEGWIAGLQMAALSMAGKKNVDDFIRDFSGSHRYILDYLAEEVLAQQSEETQDFLKKTSILDRMCAELCDEVTGMANGRQLLDELDQRNLFVIALDDDRAWYRYHHLFRDYLRARLRADAGDIAADLHARAGAWLEQQGLGEEAIAHALAGQDFERAAELVETIAEERFTVRHQVSTLGWLAQLPEELRQKRRSLREAHAFAAFVTGRWHESQAIVEATPQEHNSPKMRLIESFLSYEFGRLEDCIEQANRLLDEHAELPPHIEGLIRLSMAGALLHLDRQDETRAACARVLELGRAGSDEVNVQVALSLLAMLAAVRGDTAEVERIHTQAMAQVGCDENPKLLAAAITRVSYGEALFARNDLASAEATLAEAMDHCRRQLGLPEHVIRGGYVLARSRLSRGDTDGAQVAFDGAESLMEANLAERSQFDRLLWQALMHRAHYLAQSGQTERVTRWLDGAEHLMVSADRKRTAAQLRDQLAGAIDAEIPPATPKGGALPVPEALLEPLNDRERSLLRLMEAGMTNSEIASELYLSVHTVKWHARNLFSKLGVRNRTTAIARARELRLL